MGAIAEHLHAAQLADHVTRISETFFFMGKDDAGNRIMATLPGLDAGGLTPLLPLLLTGLKQGKDSTRAQVAALIGDAMKLTDAKALAPLVMKITGALIRVGPNMWSGDSNGDIIVWRLQTMREQHLL